MTEDRREDGFRRVLIEQDGKTKKAISVQRTMPVWQVWCARVASILGVAITVTALMTWHAGQVRVGQEKTTVDVIKEELTPPTGILYQATEQAAAAHADEVRTEFRPMSDAVIRIDERQGAILEKLEDIADDVDHVREHNGGPQ